MREGDGTEATSGDHDEAVLSAVDMMCVWALLLLLSVTLADFKICGWLPLPWSLVTAPAWVPLLVLVVVLLVATGGDLIARVRRT